MGVGKRKIKSITGEVKEYWNFFYENPTTGKATKLSSGIVVGSENHKQRLKDWLEITIPKIEAQKNAVALSELEESSSKDKFVSLSYFFETILDYIYKNTRYKTYLMYVEVFKKFGNFIVEKRGVEKTTQVKLESITPMDIEDYKNYRLKFVKGVSAHVELRTIRAAYYKAMELFHNQSIGNAINNFNPVTTIIMSGKWKNDKAKKEVLTIQEEIALFKVIKDQNFHDMFSVLIKTGMRPGEMVHLKWKNIDIKNRLIYVENCQDEIAKAEAKNKAIEKYNCTVKRPFRFEYYVIKSEDSERALPMHDDLVAIFTRKFQELEEIDLNDFVFKKPEPKDPKIKLKIKHYTVDNLNDRLSKYLEEAGITKDFHTYCFRHTKATRLKNSGVAIDDIKSILGHADISTTIENYVHSAIRPDVMNAA